MIPLVTVDQIKARLKFDHDADDDDLAQLALACSKLVLNYLKVSSDFYESSNSTESEPGTVPDEVQAATIYLVGVLLRDPSGSEMDKWKLGYLPMPVIAMLYPLRDPALA